MAAQIETDERKGCKSYFAWMMGQILPAVKDTEKERVETLCRLLYETDYICEMEEDGIRAQDATDERKIYAEKAGAEAGKDAHDIDRIWKSVHGKCSVMELLFAMAVRMDSMMNEGEEGSMIPVFFLIMIQNAGMMDKGADPKAAVERFMKREYRADGSGGGLFPLKKWNEKRDRDQRKVSIWYQMNAWLNENLDEDEHFMIEKFL